MGNRKAMAAAITEAWATWLAETAAQDEEMTDGERSGFRVAATHLRAPAIRERIAEVAVGGPEGTAPAAGDEAAALAGRFETLIDRFVLREEGAEGDPDWLVLSTGRDPEDGERWSVKAIAALLAETALDAAAATASRSERPDPGEDDPRVDILIANRRTAGQAENSPDEVRQKARHLLARLDAAAPAAPSATTEGDATVGPCHECGYRGEIVACPDDTGPWCARCSTEAATTEGAVNGPGVLRGDVVAWYYRPWTATGPSEGRGSDL